MTEAGFPVTLSPPGVASKTTEGLAGQYTTAGGLKRAERPPQSPFPFRPKATALPSPTAVKYSTARLAGPSQLQHLNIAFRSQLQGA